MIEEDSYEMGSNIIYYNYNFRFKNWWNRLGLRKSISISPSKFYDSSPIILSEGLYKIK